MAVLLYPRPSTYLWVFITILLIAVTSFFFKNAFQTIHVIRMVIQ